MSTPPFELTMQDPPRMNERLSDIADLAGETILATFDDCDTRNGEFVIVTDCFNWLVIDADADGCGEDPFPVVMKEHWKQKSSLADFVEPKRLFDAGCINSEVYRVLQTEEDNKKAAQAEATRLRLVAQLAALELKSA